MTAVLTLSALLLGLALVWLSVSDGGRLVEAAKFLPGGMYHRPQVPDGGLDLDGGPFNLVDSRAQYRGSR